MSDEAQVAMATHLYALLRTQEWDAFVIAAQELRDRKVSNLLTGTKDRFESLQGEIRGIDEVLSLPQQYLNLFKEHLHA